MRVLFYVHPLPLPQGPDFNVGWTSILARLMDGLVQSAHADCHFVTASRFAPALEGRGGDFHVGFVDEAQLLREATGVGGGSITLTGLSLQLRSGDPSSYPVQALLLKHVLKACRGFEPDVVITFGMQAQHLCLAWPGVPVLHVEVSSFSRNPYPASLFFDHAGMYGASAPALTALEAFPSNAGSRRLLRDFQTRKAQALAQHDPFKAHDFRAGFSRLVLMPLQVSNYFSYDEQCNYRTQFESLVHVLSTAPPDIGIVVSEYIQWGEVLRERGSASNLAWLRRSFRNLIFHEAFRHHDSASQYLLPHVDGLFTIASNLGLQALMLGKRLATGPRSHLRNLAHDTSLQDFFGEIRRGQAPAARDAFMAWYLERYAVPTALAERGDWFADYLTRRLVAIGRAARPIDGFVPVAPLAELRRHWLGDEPVAAAGQYETPQATSLRALARADVDAAQLAALAAAPPISTEERFGGPGDGYLLLNDTRALERYLHWGCNTVTGFIEQRLAEAGLRCLGRLNNDADCRGALARADLDQVRLVVLNGEGSLHHDNPRLLDLMRFCGWMKQRGAICVLVNAVWFENSSTSAELLAAFDVIAVRESISLKAIRKWREDARRVPDFVFAALARQQELAAVATKRPPADWVVVDHVWLPQARVLRAFAQYHCLPFYVMGGDHAHALLAEQGKVHAVGDRVFPRVMRSPADLLALQGCVTGRYHGLIAALCAGMPALALASNVPKIEGMLDDMGLGRALLLEPDWMTLSYPAQRRQMDAKLRTWTPQALQLRSDYKKAAVSEIESLWREIVAMTEQGKARSPARRPRESAAGLATIEIGDELQVFPGATATPVVAIGFHPPEPWGCWSASQESQLLLPLGAEAVRAGCSIEIRMSLLAYDPVLGKAPVLGVFADDAEIGYVFLRPGKQSRQQVTFQFTPTSTLSRVIFQFTDFASPAESGGSKDHRKLGFGLQSLTVSCRSGAASSECDATQGALQLWGIDQPDEASAVEGQLV